MRKTPKFVLLSLMIILFLNTRHAFAATILNEIRIEVGTANYELSVWDFASPGDNISYQISLLNDVNQIMSVYNGVTIPANQILTVNTSNLTMSSLQDKESYLLRITNNTTNQTKDVTIRVYLNLDFSINGSNGSLQSGVNTIQGSLLSRNGNPVGNRSISLRSSTGVAYALTMTDPMGMFLLTVSINPEIRYAIYVEDEYYKSLPYENLTINMANTTLSQSEVQYPFALEFRVEATSGNSSLVNGALVIANLIDSSGKVYWPVGVWSETEQRIIFSLTFQNANDLKPGQYEVKVVEYEMDPYDRGVIDEYIMETYKPIRFAKSLFTVTPPTRELLSINVTILPSKTVYELNDEFDPEGIQITGLYSDNNYYVIYDLPTYSYDFSVSGVQLVAVDYLGKTTSLNVSVSDQTRDDDEYIVQSLFLKETYDTGYLFETKVLRNSQTNYVDYVVAFFYDEENRFLGLNYVYAKLEYNEASRIGFFVPGNSGAVHRIKVTLINSLSMLTPLASAKEIILN